MPGREKPFIDGNEAGDGESFGEEISRKAESETGRELRFEMPGDDSDDSTARARDQKTEAAYEVMSAGATAPDAGQIASELAHGLRDADAWVIANEAKKKAAEANREVVLPK